LEPWSGKQFCDSLGNRTVLLVGDSTLQQVSATLVNMIVTTSGGCAHQIFFAKCYHLYWKEKDEMRNNIREYVEDVKPDIVVFSAGAHMHDTGDIYSTLENVRSLLPAMIENVRLSSGKNLSFVWKTQSPGHVSCDAVSEPQTYELAPAHLDRWQWNLHQYFDDFSKNWSTIMNYKVNYIVLSMITDKDPL
jgi:hypothetical protein